jgi:hypothetical protein
MLYFPTKAAWTHTINLPNPPNPTPTSTSLSPTRSNTPTRPTQTLQQTTLNLICPTSLPCLSQNTSSIYHFPTADKIINKIYPPLDASLPLPPPGTSPSPSSSAYQTPNSPATSTTSSLDSAPLLPII